MEKYISSGKAAEMLGVSISTMVVWENEGRISSVKTIGSHRRYKLSDVEGLMSYISPAEAAKMLGVSTQSLRQWELAGKIKAIRMGTKKRSYLLEDIKRLLYSAENRA